MDKRSKLRNSERCFRVTISQVRIRDEGSTNYKSKIGEYFLEAQYKIYLI